MPFHTTLIGCLGEVGFGLQLDALLRKNARSVPVKRNCAFHPDGQGDGGFDFECFDWTIDVKTHSNGLTVPRSRKADIYVKTRLLPSNGAFKRWLSKPSALGWARDDFELKVDFVGWIGTTDIVVQYARSRVPDAKLDKSFDDLLSLICSRKLPGGNAAPAWPK